jgi:hypothetical protein
MIPHVDVIALFGKHYKRTEVLEEIVDAITEGAELKGIVCPSLRRRRYRPKPRVSAAAKPQSATLGNASPQFVCTPTGFHNGNTSERYNDETPLGFGCWWSLNPGCAARPWALFFNRFAVSLRLGVGTEWLLDGRA